LEATQVRKHLIIIVLAMSVAGGGVALASHVSEIDPATVPPGFLAAHNRVADVPVGPFARAMAADGAEVTVQHIRLVANQPIPWHTHPGPVFVLVERGAFTYEYAQGSKCVSTTYTAGQGFVDQGFGHVHQANAGPDGAEIYAVYVFPPDSPIHLIPASPAEACTS
jgi:quercetin dioxygenase-like cupin family protein